MTRELRTEVMKTPESRWRLLQPGGGVARGASRREWEEICFVPKWIDRGEKGRYGFPAVREPWKQPPLPGMTEQLELSFPTVEFGSTLSEVTASAANPGWEGEQVIHWYRERCGKTEEDDAITKNDPAGGRTPGSRSSASVPDSSRW